MEVHGQQHEKPRPTRNDFAEARMRLFQANRARTRNAHDELARVKDLNHDVIDVRADLVSEQERKRDARVKELHDAHRAGNLNTPERIERAAQRLLDA